MDFNGNFGHLCGMMVLSNCLVYVVETFTDILKHYFFQITAVKFVKCML